MLSVMDHLLHLKHVSADLFSWHYEIEDVVILYGCPEEKSSNRGMQETDLRGR